jgi:uncharacterized protein (DUF2237 family)
MTEPRPDDRADGQPKNVLGTPLISCCTDPVTGFYRDGFCQTGPQDLGAHVVCAKMTTEFLAFTASRGNDLSTPAPQYGFPGLEAGDYWCLCADRWMEAYKAGVAPSLVLEATHEKMLEWLPRSVLEEFAL